MSEKPTFEVFTTPVGELVYPWLTRADTRYDPDGVFQTKLLLPFENAQELIAKLEKVLSDYIATLDGPAANYNPADVYEDELDENNEPTGNVMFRFKLKNKVTPREGDAFTQAPVLVMAEDGSAVGAPIYGGTMARIKGQIVPYVNASGKALGLTLRMRSVQVHELVSGGSESGAFWSDFD
jgi:hypothetical protein